MGALRAVGFDLGDTLCEYAGIPLNWESRYTKALAAVAERCGRELNADRLQAGVRILTRYNTRHTPRKDHREYAAAQIFSELLGAWGATLEHLPDCIEAFFAHFRQTLRAFPDALGVLPQLQALGVPTGVLTDVPYGMPERLVLADLFETGLHIPEARLITSSSIGHRKPHGAGFAALARELGVPCTHLTYVGNERKDVDGALAAGCRAVLLWRSTEPAPAWGQAFTLHSLEQLLALP